MELETRAQVWGKTNGHCWYCGKIMNPWDDFTVDHMDPRIQGGGNELLNLAPCCKTCNSRKGGKTVQEFRAYLQSKNKWQFWEEVSRVGMTEKSKEEDDGNPNFEDYTEIMDACFRIGRCSRVGVSLTLIALVTFAFDWGKNTGRDYGCAGFCDIESLSWKTGQPFHSVLSDMFCLIRNGLLALTWRGGPDGIHRFDLSLGIMLRLGQVSKGRANR